MTLINRIQLGLARLLCPEGYHVQKNGSGRRKSTGVTAEERTVLMFNEEVEQAKKEKENENR